MRVLVLSLIVLLSCQSADARHKTRYAIRPMQTVQYRTAVYSATRTVYKPARTVYQANPAVPATQVVQTATQTVTASYVASGTSDYGFTAWLNATRAQYGLGAVSFDPNLANWAAQNNNQQAARGLGHYVMGPARRQNSGMGSYSVMGAMWMASPAHRSALLDPTIRTIGIAGLGVWWTFNAY